MGFYSSAKEQERASRWARPFPSSSLSRCFSGPLRLIHSPLLHQKAQPFTPFAPPFATPTAPPVNELRDIASYNLGMASQSRRAQVRLSIYTNVSLNDQQATDFDHYQTMGTDFNTSVLGRGVCYNEFL